MFKGTVQIFFASWLAFKAGQFLGVWYFEAAGTEYAILGWAVALISWFFWTRGYRRIREHLS